MDTNQQTVRSVFGKPAKTYEDTGVLTLSIVLTIPSVGNGRSRTKHATLATYRNVTRLEARELKARFCDKNDEYDFGAITAKWQVIQYL